MLYNLTTQLFDRVKDLSCSCKNIVDPTRDNDYEIFGTIQVVVESELDILVLTMMIIMAQISY